MRTFALLASLALLLVSCGGEAPGGQAQQGGTEGRAAAPAAKTPAAKIQVAAEGIDADGHMHPGDADRCPVCAMKTKDKKMVSAIELEGGDTHYFCGTGCMMRSWLHPDHFLAAGGKKPKRAVTVDFFTGKHIDANQALWIAGSDVTGPMGRMIVPVMGEEAAKKFRERHGGHEPFKLSELDDAMWQKLMGKKAMPDAKN